MNTPSRGLAEQVVDRLVGEGLVTPEDAGRLLPKIEAGGMRPEDWRLAVEQALMRAAEHE